MKLFNYLILLSIIFCIDYNAEIQPIFNNNCGNCHLGNSSGNLNLSSYNDLMSNNVVVPGDHQASELYIRIILPESSSSDMPPNGSLSDNEIDLIADWINEGALEFEINSCDLLGDINEDGIVNILDVVGMVNIILAEANSSECSDINEDGELNILDVVIMVNYILAPDNL